MLSLSLSLLTTLCYLPQLTLATLTSKGFSVAVNDIDYFVSPYVAGKVSFNASLLAPGSSVFGFYPVTVVQEKIGLAELPALVKNYTSKDDVFQEEFLMGMFSAYLMCVLCRGVGFMKGRYCILYGADCYSCFLVWCYDRTSDVSGRRFV